MPNDCRILYWKLHKYVILWKKKNIIYYMVLKLEVIMARRRRRRGRGRRRSRRLSKVRIARGGIRL